LKDGVLEQKKGELELIHTKSTKISYKNILCKEFEDLVQKYNKWRAPFALLLLLLLRQNCLF